MAQVMARGGSRRRRTMNEINMVPFIDVMLVLLIIFMVTAPLITTGVIDLPSVGKSNAPPQSVIEVIVGNDARVKLKIDGKADALPITLPQMAARVKAVQAANAATAVVISAERNVKYEAVVQVMNELQQEGVKRVGLLVKQGS